MIEGIMAFLAAWGIVTISILAFLGILFEHNGARGWSVFLAMVTLIVAYFSFNVPLMTIALGAVGYIVIGLIWSFWRYKRHAAKVVEEYRNESADKKQWALAKLHPRAMLSTITAWIMIWPFSLVENLIGDIINTIQLLVTKFFRGVYHKVYDAAVSQLK